MRIGLTGGIGSGKSTAARAWVALGAGLVDTDAIARELTGPDGDAMPAIVGRFGEGVRAADGALDRDAMRALAFGDDSARLDLEGILHPMIGIEARRRGATLLAVHGRVLFDVPLLAESRHWRGQVDRIVVVDCPVAVQVQRVQARSGWDEATVRAVIARQAPREARRALADAVLYNDGLTPLALAAEVAALDRRWCGA